MVYIKHLQLDNFRSYKHKVIDFKQGINIIVGPNGVGKTNIIEGIYYLCLGSSFKTSNTKSLVKNGESNFKVQASITANRHKLSQERLFSSRNSTSKSASKNFDKSNYSVILFSPESTNIINSSPAIRRDYIDNIITQYDAKYQKVINGYNHIIKQRSCLIAQLGANHANNDLVKANLGFWNEKYATHSSYITISRMKLINRINEILPLKYSDIVKHMQQQTDLQCAEVRLETNINPNGDDFDYEQLSNKNYTKNLENLILKELDDSFEKEKILGWTSVGAKSDDLVFTLNGNTVKGNSSFGEQWSIMIAFVLSAWQILKDAEKSFSKYEPILLFDDVFTGLDEHRRNGLIKLISGITQCIITCADEKDIPKIKHNRIDLRYVKLEKETA